MSSDRNQCAQGEIGEMLLSFWFRPNLLTDFDEHCLFPLLCPAAYLLPVQAVMVHTAGAIRMPCKGTRDCIVGEYGDVTLFPR